VGGLALDLFLADDGHPPGSGPGPPAVRAHRGWVVASILVGALTAPIAESVPLVWHVESEDGVALDARDADSPINPASLTKVATSLWALERLGPDHRFGTRFASSATLDPSTGVLEGDLVVLGSGDPDFHVENAYLVARALNDLGLRTVRGRLLVDETFWIGWEGGSERRETDGERRMELLKQCWDDAADFTDRYCQIQGRDALNQYIGGIQAMIPGFAIEMTGSPKISRTYIAFEWIGKDKDGKAFASGTDFGEIGLDGRIRKIVGFWNP